MTGQCHSPGQFVQLPTDPAPRWNNGLEFGLNQAFFSVDSFQKKKVRQVGPL
jgi:hypothetical protein